MTMKHRWFWIAVILILWASPALGETIYLKTGEVIKGKIVRADQNAISIESDKGFGVIQVKREDIITIEFDQNERDISRFFGLGYFHRIVPLRIESLGLTFGVDAISMKMWFSSKRAAEILFGYYTATGSGLNYDALYLEGRYTQVFSRRAKLDMYWGFGAGIVDITDDSRGITESGTILEAFLGAESFFTAMPNLSISTEIGINVQEVGSNTSSTIIAPALVIRYYF